MPNQPILDAAYQLAKKAHSSASHAEAKDKLHSMFADASWDEILDAYLKGCELAEKCYEVGDVAHRETLPDDQAIQMLRQRFPGFSARTYSDALTLGWFLSR